MDKIKCYNDIVKASPEIETENFLNGILYYFNNIEFFYTFVKAIDRKFKKITIYPSFRYQENGTKRENKMEQLLFKVEGVDNRAMCKMLKKKIECIKNRHGKAYCDFTYDKKSDRIALIIHDIQLNEGEIVSAIKN